VQLGGHHCSTSIDRARPTSRAPAVAGQPYLPVDLAAEGSYPGAMAEELLFTVAGSTANRATPITLAEAGLRERQDLQEWVLEHPEILGPDVMVVTFEFDQWWSASGSQPLDRLDVLGLDDTGRLVVCELKRDRAPDSIEMQAIKYAAMASRFTLDTLASQHARFLGHRGTPSTEEEALDRLTGHADELSGETIAQPRIVLVASEFPPVVSATVVWLTEMGLDMTLVQYRAYRTDTQILLSVSQLYPVPDVEDFTVSPRQAEARAAVQTKKRTRETSAVRRLINAGTLADGTELTIRPQGVNAEIREALEEWLAEDPKRRRATWQNKASAPLIWEADGGEHTPSGLASDMIMQTSGLKRDIWGTRWWVDDDGRDLVELSAPGKRNAYLAFWTRFLDLLRERHPEWSKARIPQPDSWFNMPCSRRGTHYSVSFAQGGRLRSELYVDGGDADENMSLFQALQAERQTIESAYGSPLGWEELPGKQACRIADYGQGDAADTDEHETYIDWFLDSQERLRIALGAVGTLIE
jgi:hypothetical protein